MKIRSDYPGKVFYRFFNSDDSWYWVGLFEGTISQGEEIELAPPSPYQVEFKKNGLFGEFLKTPWGSEHKPHPYDNMNVDGFHIYEDGIVAVVLILMPVGPSVPVSPMPTRRSNADSLAWRQEPARDTP